jgi:hypothetical protein
MAGWVQTMMTGARRAGLQAKNRRQLLNIPSPEPQTNPNPVLARHFLGQPAHMTHLVETGEVTGVTVGVDLWGGEEQISV